MSLLERIQLIPVVDSHEHLMPLGARNEAATDFSYLFSNYLRPEFASCGMSASEVESFYSRETDEEAKARLFLSYWPALENTSFARLKREAAADLFDVEDFSEAGLKLLSERIRESAHESWYEQLLNDSGIQAVVINYLKTHRLMGWTEESEPLFRYTANFDDFVWIRSPVDVQDLEEELSVSIRDLESLVSALRTAFDRRIGPRVCAVKTVLAYFRPLLVDEQCDPEAAAEIFDRLLKESPRPFDSQLRGQDVPWARAFQDYMIHEILRLASEYPYPVQVHVGYQAGNGNFVVHSDPLQLTSLFFRYPELNFELLHVGYPYQLSSLALAKMFPNVFLNFSWLFALAPSVGREALRHAVELVPASKIVAFGGDYRLIEGVIVHLKWARRVIAQVLERKIAEGYWGEPEALDFAERILFKNPLRLYGLEEPKGHKG